LIDENYNKHFLTIVLFRNFQFFDLPVCGRSYERASIAKDTYEV